MLKFNKKIRAALVSAILSITILAVIIICFNIKIFEHSPYDSYTRQALAWRDGRTYLDNDPSEIAYLELAIFEGKYYVSFPPVPSVIEFFLTFIFGQNTPNRFMLVVFTVVSCIALTLLFIKKHNIIISVTFGILSTLGSNLLGMIAFGGVWHEAQILSFMLCSLAALFIHSDKKLLNGLSLFLAALAVGCRPFTVIFFPFLLIKLYQNNKGEKIYKLLFYLISPALVAILLMGYNIARFGNPFEFGHNYLPEFLNSADGQFSFAYLLPNFIQSIKLPFLFVPEFKLNVNLFSANIFYIFNPIIGVFFFYNIKNCIFRRNLTDYLYPVAVIIFVLATCMHKTLGGAQFGARYFVDMIPFLAMYIATQKINFKFEFIRTEICILALALNIYGVFVVTTYLT